LAATSDKFGKTVGQDSEEHEARQVKEWSENNKVFARQRQQVYGLQKAIDTWKACKFWKPDLED
jgi:hypothetical protein